MKDKNTKENKEAFLANYLNAPIINIKTGHSVPTQHLNFTQCMSEDNDIRPILKDLKKIPIEDILNVISILDPSLDISELDEDDFEVLTNDFYKPFIDQEYPISENSLSPINYTNTIDYLRELGYVTYFRGISPDEMYNFGWFITEELVSELKFNETTEEFIELNFTDNELEQVLDHIFTNDSDPFVINDDFIEELKQETNYQPKIDAFEKLKGFTIYVLCNGEHHTDGQLVDYEFTFISPNSHETIYETLASLMGGVQTKDLIIKL